MNKIQVGYAIVRKSNGTMPVIQATLPIYWSKKVALERVDGFPNFEVVKVKIESHIITRVEEGLND